MGQEPAAAVYHIGVTRGADADAGDQVPHELKVDLHHRHTLAAEVWRQGDGHIGLGLLEKMDGAEIGKPGPRLAKGRLSRAVGGSADAIHGETRHANLLASARVQPAGLGDGRDLAQQLQQLDIALVDGLTVTGLGEQGPANLALDVPGELLDVQGRCQGLLTLEGKECGAGLLVGEIELSALADEQGRDTQHDEVPEVLTKQPALGPGPHARLSFDDAIGAQGDGGRDREP